MGVAPSTFQVVYFGLSPLPVTVANEGLVRDSLLKMVHNPGGDEPASWEGGLSRWYILEYHRALHSTNNIQPLGGSGWRFNKYSPSSRGGIFLGGCDF